MAKSQVFCGSREDRVSWAQLALCQLLSIPAKIKILPWDAPESNSHCETTSSTLRLDCLKNLFGIFRPLSWSSSIRRVENWQNILPHVSFTRKIQLLFGSDARCFTKEHEEAGASSLWDNRPRHLCNLLWPAGCCWDTGPHAAPISTWALQLLRAWSCKYGEKINSLYLQIMFTGTSLAD